MTTSTRKSQKGTLAIVGLLFLLSGAFRLASDAGQVFAEEPKTSVEDIVAEETRPLDRDHPARPEHLTNALAAIRDREARLVEREEEILERERSVESAEAAIRAELAKLQTTEEQLRKTINLASEA